MFAAGTATIDALDKRRAFPISGDATRRHRAESVVPVLGRGINIWKGRNVKPALATAGIVKGGRIRVRNMILNVTAVGTHAGWGIAEGGTQERRWEAHEVREIL